MTEVTPSFDLLPSAPATEEAPPQKTVQQEVIQEEPSGAPSFLESLPEDMREPLSKFKDPASLGKSYMELQKKLGERDVNTLTIPGEGATPEERAAFLTKLGVPESADKYEFRPMEGLPEGFEVTSEMDKKFAEVAKKANLTQNQAALLRQQYYSELSGGHVQSTEQAKAAQEKAHQDTVSVLKEAWGEKAIDSQLDFLGDVMTKLGGEEFLEVFKSIPDGVARGKGLVALAKMAEGFKRDVLVDGALSTMTGTMTKDQARQQIENLRSSGALQHADREVRYRALEQQQRYLQVIHGQ